MQMETEAVMEVLSWTVQQDDTHGVVVMDTQSMLHKIERGLLCHE